MSIYTFIGGELLKSVRDNLNANFAALALYPDFYKYSIVTSIASNNLTVALKNYLGNDPTAAAPVKIQIGGVIRTITSACSATLNAGTNYFNLGSAELATKEVDLFVYLGYQDANSSVRFGISRYGAGNTYNDFGLYANAPTGEKCLTVDSNINGMNSGNAVTNIGRFNAILSGTASYNWSIPATSVIINSPCYETRLLTWLPTYTGAGSLTYTGVTTNIASYQIKNNKLFISIYASGTTGGTTNNAIRASLPFSITIESYSNRPPCYFYDPSNANSRVGIIFSSSATYLSFANYVIANWSLGGGIEIAFLGELTI